MTMELIGPSATPTQSDRRRWKLNDFEKLVSRHAHCVSAAARAAANLETIALTYIKVRDSRAAETMTRKVALTDLRDRMETAQVKVSRTTEEMTKAANTLYDAYHDALD